MATNATVMTKLQSLLKNTTSLSSFIKDVFLGARVNVIEYPAVFLIPVSEVEIQNAHPVERIQLNVNIYGVNPVIESDNAIVSTDANTVGIMDFVNKIKKVLDGNNTLDSTVINVSYGTIEYGYDDGKMFFSLPVVIEYRTVAGTRT